MAISPREAAELSDDERTRITEIEAEIDEQLRRQYHPGVGTINLVLDSYTDRILDALARRYRAAGWAEADWHRRKRGSLVDFIIEAGTVGDNNAKAGL